MITSSSDTSELSALTKRAKMSKSDMLNIEKPAGLTIVNNQRTLVPKDTAATMLSIHSEVITATANVVTAQIGPTTIYAPAIEFGIPSKPNYPIQPFVRPSIFGAMGKAVVKAAATAFNSIVRKRA